MSGEILKIPVISCDAQSCEQFFEGSAGESITQARADAQKTEGWTRRKSVRTNCLCDYCPIHPTPKE